MSGKNPFLGMGFGSPFITFARASSSGGGGGGAANKIVVGAMLDDDDGSGSGSAYVYNLDGTGEVKITASDAAGGDNFGESVAIGNNKIVVGARGDDDNGSGSGSVYVYNLDGTGEVKITASDGAADEAFGRSVAVGNNKIVVGAELHDIDIDLKGAVYVYNLDGTGEVKITASDGASIDRFGRSVAIGSNKIVVGAYQDDDDGSSSGSAYIYNLDGTGEVKITASDAAGSDQFGTTVAIANNKIVVGSPYDDDDGTSSGSVYVYDLDGTNEIKITASDAVGGERFGTTVAIANNKIVVGAEFTDDGATSGTGAVYVYDLDGTGEVKITASDRAKDDFFGSSVFVGNNKIVVGARGDDDNGSASGSVYVYDLDGTNEVKITASDGAASDKFGSSVAVA